MKVLMALLLALTAAAATLIYADEARAGDTRQITVTGRGVVEAVPDMATITLGVTHEDAEAATAMQMTADVVSQMLVALESKGVQPRDLQTQNLSLNPVWSNRSSSSDKQPQITGYAASNTVLVRVRDLEDLGEILDAVAQLGANNFNGLRFSVQEPESLVEEARKEAVVNAMAKAQTLADAAGVKLGPVMSISEQRTGGPRPMAAMDMEMRAASVPVAAGEVALSASVTMVFAIAE
ncbi:SIMPL domain-containing protein [Primorskyibacter sp. S87]|uniref:SIMPL domain-containing protein n=1 Tax=Primorskyibacter sp. S87 TaxID=3415126 RepID=UPI003C79D47B